ncbi:hypothetical protein WJX72_001853 [[Myrmecia] bisecta]|uniref:Mitochondrial import inner membrane translocase subunit TIM50 n=1 Tax=[Myrmecia] bisecta TaxID=41462 RepID=A0AAW1QPG7_9CHLO
MLLRAAQAWRTAQRSVVTHSRSNVRAFSESSTGSPSTSAATGNGGAAPGLDGPAGRVFSVLGNTLFFGALAAGGFFGYYTYRYNTDQIGTMIDETQKEENSFPGSQVWSQVMKWYLEKRRDMESEVKKYSDPPSDRLLPDLPPHASHVRTLVLDLDDTLIHSDWTRGRGWRTFKRPGAEEFLRHMAQYYELVVYTNQLPTYADPILDRLDPNRLVQFRLYKDSTQYVDGKHVRDLSKLNRDLGRVLLVSAKPEAYALQPENAVKVRPWKLETEDTCLLDLIPFLEAVYRTNVPDVRAVVRSYEGQDIPTAFRERMQRVAEQQRQKVQKPKGLFGSLSR